MSEFIRGIGVNINWFDLGVLFGFLIQGFCVILFSLFILAFIGIIIYFISSKFDGEED